MREVAEALVSDSLLNASAERVAKAHGVSPQTVRRRGSG